jgi:hypothetical protein
LKAESLSADNGGCHAFLFSLRTPVVSADGYVDNSPQASSCPHIHSPYGYFNPTLVQIIKIKERRRTTRVTLFSETGKSAGGRDFEAEVPRRRWKKRLLDQKVSLW